MRKRGLPEDRVSSTGLSIVASFVLHIILLLALFVVWPSWHKPEMPPVVVSVHLVSLPQESAKKPAVTQVQTVPKKEKTIEKPKPSVDAIAIEQKKKTEAEKKRVLEKQRREAWLKKQAFLKEKARRKALQEKNAKKMAERKAQDELAQKKLQQLAAEQLKQIQVNDAAAQQAETTKTQQLVARYSALIRQKVSSDWSYPLDSTKQMTTSVKLTLAPTGEIISLTLVKSSGNSAFDQSVKQAIRAAAPFDALSQLSIRVFEANFRTLNLKFTPQDLME